MFGVKGHVLDNIKNKNMINNITNIKEWRRNI